MSFFIEIGNTRLSNEVHNLVVEGGGGSTGPTGPAGLPGPTGPAGTGPLPQYYPVVFSPGFAGTGVLYRVDNTVYWNFSLYIPPDVYPKQIYPISNLGTLYDVLPSYYNQYRHPYVSFLTNKPFTGDLLITKNEFNLWIYIPMPTGGETTFNFSYQV